MESLPKGANALLSSAGTVCVELSWPRGRGALDTVCFAVGDNGRIPSDDWFIFYNQLTAPNGVVVLSPPADGHAEIRLQLDRLPPALQRVIIAAAVTEGSFRDRLGVRLTITPARGQSLAIELNETEDEQALIFAECYRHGSGWKVRAVGQGFRGGLQPLAEHFGVAVADETPAAPVPSDARPPPAPLPLEATPAPNRERRRTGWRWTLALLLLLAPLFGALAWFQPTWLDRPAALWAELREQFSTTSSTATLDAPQPQPTTVATSEQHATPERRTATHYQALTCPWPDAEVFERYHALGENYVRILQRVERSNKLLSKWRNELRESAADCSDPFVVGNQQEAEQLQQLPVAAWMEESIKLNNCAGLMIKKLDKDLNHESRPIILQRLVRDADRARNLESDLTDISRDLAYLRNKTERLLDGFQENIEACAR